jgi:hypothetical protein
MWAVGTSCCPQGITRQSLTTTIFHLSAQATDQLIIPWSGVQIPPGLFLRELIDKFLVQKRNAVDLAELFPASLRDYEKSCRRLNESFGDRIVDSLLSADFARLRSQLASTRGPASLGNEITRIRVVFIFAHDNCLIDRPVRYGTAFRKPSKRVLRLEKARKGPKLFQSDEIHRLLNFATIRCER